MPGAKRGKRGWNGLPNACKWRLRLQSHHRQEERLRRQAPPFRIRMRISVAALIKGLAWGNFECQHRQLRQRHQPRTSTSRPCRHHRQHRRTPRRGFRRRLRPRRRPRRHHRHQEECQRRQPQRLDHSQPHRPRRGPLTRGEKRCERWSGQLEASETGTMPELIPRLASCHHRHCQDSRVRLQHRPLHSHAQLPRRARELPLDHQRPVRHRACREA